MTAHFSPSVPSVVCIAAGIMAAAAQVWFWKRTALRGWPRVSALGLRLSAIGLLAWILSGPQRPILETADGHPAVILTDISRSMDFPAVDGSRAAEARRIVQHVTKSAPPGGGVESLAFGSRLLTAGESPAAGDPVRGRSLPAAGLRELLATRDGKSTPHSVLLISDGAAQDAAELTRVAIACRKRGVPVSVLCTGGDVTVKNASLVTIDAERRIKAGTKVPVTVTTHQTGCDESLRIELLGGDDKVIDQALTSAAPGSPAEQNVTLYATTGAEGFSGKVRITPVAGEITLTDNEAPVLIGSDNATLRVLYMEGSTGNYHGLPEPCFLAQALGEAGDIEVDLLCLNLLNTSGGSVLVGWPWKTPGRFQPDPSKSYPRTREELNRYDVVICSDIPRVSFTPEQILWTVDLVAERGAGFIMIGGNTSFGSGFWDRTPWEKLIPLDMDDASRGFRMGSFPVFWPQEGKRHPLLAQLPLQKGESLDQILNAHPVLLGTNLIHRAKPAATVLMRMDNETGAPIIAVQPFGKGRTMAFTSDVTYLWGTLHNRAWGPPETAVSNMVLENFSAGPSEPTPVNNSYYRRFWQRSIRWLAENSIRVKGAQFEASTPWLAWPGQSPLPVHAAAPDESMMARLSGAPCIAQIRGIAGTRTRLAWDAAANRFAGAIPRPAGLPEEAVIDVEATDPLQREPRRASFTVRVPQVDPETTEPSARPDILAALAESSGGKVLHSAGEAAAWLAARTAALNAPERAGARPAWDRMWVLAAVLFLLSADWLIRRFHS